MNQTLGDYLRLQMERYREVESDNINHDTVNHPKHYTSHPSGVEAIQITEHLNFCLGNAVKYCFRSGNKVQSDDTEDLRKAIWYAERDVESVLGGQKIRGFGSWPSAKLGDSEDQITRAYQEWVHDVAVFLASNTAIPARDGARNFYWREANRFGCLPLERESSGQQAGKSSLGISEYQHVSEKSARDRASWGETMVSETDRTAGERNKVWDEINNRHSGAVQRMSNDSVAYPFRHELAAYIAHESQEWRKRAVFYLSTGEPVKALWYINRLVAELEKKNGN